MHLRNIYSSDISVNLNIIRSLETEEAFSSSDFVQYLSNIFKQNAPQYQLYKGSQNLNKLPLVEKNMFQIMQDPSLLGKTGQAIISRTATDFEKQNSSFSEEGR